MKEMVGGCCVCSDERGWTENPLVYCDGNSCNVAVHQACYGIIQVPTGPWFCRRCESQERIAKVRCELCPSKDGALKRTDNGGWAHVVCALYIPEVRFGNLTTMEPIVLELVPQERFHKTCYLCEEQGKESKASIGACMQCNKQGCKYHFHVTCAQAAGLLCEEAGNYNDNVKYCGYCSYHYQKLKKDNSNIKIIPAFKPIPFDNASSESSPDKKSNTNDEFKFKKKPKLSRTNGIESDRMSIAGIGESEKDVKKVEKKKKKLSIESRSPSPVKMNYSEKEKDEKDPTPSFTAMYGDFLAKVKETDDDETEDDEITTKKIRVTGEKKKIKKNLYSSSSSKSLKLKDSALVRKPKKKKDSPKQVINGDIKSIESKSKLNGSSSPIEERREAQRIPDKVNNDDNDNSRSSYINTPLASHLTSTSHLSTPNMRPDTTHYSANQSFSSLCNSIPPPPNRPRMQSTIREIPDGPQSLEQLLERQWTSGAQLIMDEAAHFDVASLLSCLHKLRRENDRLEEQLRGLVARRDHLIAVNSRLSMPLSEGYIYGDGMYGVGVCAPFLRGLDKR